MTNDHWSFHRLEGYNDSGWVVCNGSWTPDEARGPVLILDFNAMDVPLEDELRKALPPGTQALWTKLRPRGTIDQLRVGVRFEPAAKHFSVEIAAAKRPPEQNVEGRSITIKPQWLPYQWDDVVGNVLYRNGVLELKNLRAQHGDTKIELSGSAHTDPSSGKWTVRLSPVNVDHLDTSHELAASLPPQLGEALMKLNVRGLVSLSGSMELAGWQDARGPTTATWNVDVDLENGAVSCGVPLQHIHGSLALEGGYDGRTAFSRGELAVDSLLYNGIQLTAVRGPIFLQDSSLWIGNWIPEAARDGLPQPVSASVWDGNVSMNAHVRLGEVTQYDLEAALRECDLATISREATPHKHDIAGKVYAHLLLVGSSHGVHTLRGKGTAQLREADVYDLPLIIALLKTLRFKTPDTTAFTDSDAEFRIEGDRIYFDRLDFHGDAISLNGRGEMNLERQIHLTFSSIVGRDDFYVPLVRPLLKEAGRRLMLIQVTGSLDAPDVKRELVPELNETLQQVFPAAPSRQQHHTTRTPGPDRTHPGMLPRSSGVSR
jgi:hypothetical protein